MPHLTPPPIRLGTRGSRLALAQSRMVQAALAEAGIPSQTVVLTTTGDRIRRPLAEFGGKALFAKELEEALLADEIDLAVHSMKDLPAILPAGLALAGVLERACAFDTLVLAPGLSALPAAPRLGTGAVRRGAQARRAFPDAEILPLRGNVDTRLRKLDEGGFDALILSAAGLARLGLDARIGRLLDGADWLPALTQGTIGLEIRDGDPVAQAAAAAITHEDSFLRAICERAFQAGLQGNCHSPIAGLARIQDGELHFAGEVLAPDGSDSVRCAFALPVDAGAVKIAARAQGAGADLRPRAKDWL